MPIQKVLVVDDSKTELMFLTDVLQKQGMQVRTAENAEEAMRRLAEDKPDLILMDVVMPGQNGFQLTRAISRDPLYADVPIIMCTSKNQETDRVWACARAPRPTSPSRWTDGYKRQGHCRRPAAQQVRPTGFRQRR